MAFYVVQFLTGLASAASLFLVASGLSIIFGVTRIVNFAHGAFYMLGAYLAFTLTERFAGALGFWGGIVAAALAVAVVGVIVEMVLLRRIYHSPELFQLLATFGLTLMVEDLVVLIWGPSDLLGRRAPGFKGAVEFFGQNIPSYDLFLIVLGPAVLGVLWLLFQRTRWGVLVRAATQDRDMVAALGVNQKWLFTSVFALGVFLAGLGGALQIPRDAVNHAMDLRIIVEVFVVVVIGGLGSIIGAFVAAVLVSELNAFGILIFPKISIILVFLVMAVVLIVRPWGLFGKPEAQARRSPGLSVNPWRPLSSPERLAATAVILIAAALPLFAGNYALTVGAEIAIFVIFAASLHFLMSVGGLASFGHAAYFGLGAYGVAFLAKMAGLPMIVCVLIGPLLGLLGAAVFGFFAVQLSGVYFAMLTLAFAQIVWSIAFQWVEVTGGDNGILGVWPSSWAASPSHFYWLALGIAVLMVAGLRTAIFSPFGFALRATRDSPLRAEAIGINGKRTQWTAFVIAGTVAGVGGALFAYLKGSVFPDSLGISLSVDALVMVLLGGVETISGAVVGAVVYKALNIWLVSQTDLSKLVLGAFIVLIVVAFPKGIVGVVETIRLRYRRPSSQSTVLTPKAESAE
jgi:branched-chain amino acid transport system permease protein